MTLPKRKSRSIEVEQVRYRYVISKSASMSNGWFTLNLTIQVESGIGSILKVVGLTTRDHWLDFPQLETADRYLSLNPRHAARLIRHALIKGWDAQQAGVPFHLDASKYSFMKERECHRES